MIVEINGYKYIDPNWSISGGTGVMKLANKIPFNEVIRDFVLSPGDVIKEYTDKEEQIGQYYVQRMGSIEMPDGNGEDKIIIRYVISDMSEGAEKKIETALDEVTGSILELAAMVADMNAELDKKFEGQKSEQETKSKLAGEKVDDMDKRIDRMQETLNIHNEMFKQIQQMVNMFADRIAKLENGVNRK